MPTGNEKLIETGVDVVEPDQVEATIQAKQIGERIRKLRSRRSLGLVELGQKTGLSASFLSQLETGRVVPTVRNLARIAMVFGKDLSYFFQDDQPITFRTMRRNERVRIHLGSDAAPSFRSESLHALVTDNQMVPCIAEFALSEQDAIFRPKIFEGTEFTYILEGRLTLVSGQEQEILEVGDVVWIDSARKRHYCCTAGSEAKAVIITRSARA